MPAVLAPATQNSVDARRDHAWFPGGDHDEALSRMMYLVERGEGCGLIRGPAGSGRSRLLHELHRQSRLASTVVVPLNVTGWDRTMFPVAVANACGAINDAAASPTVAWTGLEDWLRGRTVVQGRVLWLFDDFDLARESLEPEFGRLARLAERTHTPSVLIATVADETSLEVLRRWVDFTVELTPWDADTSREFVEQTLLTDGPARVMIDDDAWEELIVAGEGRPSRLLRLMEVAVLAREVMQADSISAELIHAVAGQLGGTSHASARMLPVD
ncbi:MAG TPA: hypothetical protein VFG20_01350 [Planctomycetaceae bacterium]|nr:hypothetical protein [Planctomycetaceae bacterium]